MSVEVSEHSSSLFRRADQFVFSLEQRLVTIAAMLMTVSVCLDIIYRSLKGQQSEPFVSLMYLFGAIGQQSSGLDTDVAPIITLLVLPCFFGWAVYASLHRGEEGIAVRALKHGVLWTVGAVVGSVMIYQLPSSYVCALLTLGIGALISTRAVRIERWINMGLTLLVTVGCLSLPQGYIWSQELSLILLAWVAFLGASMATYQHKHIQISALSGLTPTVLKPYVRAIGLMVTALFSAYITISLGISVFGDKGSFVSGELRPATGIPAWVILFSGVISFALISIRSCAYGIWGLINPDEPSEVESVH